MSSLTIRQEDLKEMNLLNRVPSAIKAYLNYLPQEYLDDFVDDLCRELEDRDKTDSANSIREIYETDVFSIGQDQCGDLILCTR